MCISFARITRRNPYSSLRRQAGGSSTSREDSSVNKAPRDWVPPASSQSWSSSVDSELATVGSFDTEVSLDDKQSFAVFSSVSCDSRENLAPDTMQQDMDAEPGFPEASRKIFTNQLQPVTNSGQSACRFQSPRCEKHSTQSDCSKKEDSETPHPSESEMIDESKNKLLVNSSSFKMRPCTAQNSSAVHRNTETHYRNQPSLAAESRSHESIKELIATEEANNLHEPISINDSADEVHK